MDAAVGALALRPPLAPSASNTCQQKTPDSEPYFTNLQTTAKFAEARAAGQGCQRDFLAATRH